MSLNLKITLKIVNVTVDVTLCYRSELTFMKQKYDCFFTLTEENDVVIYEQPFY
jgi:hypothetical protein